jgi:small subunit ribosomal protein S24e
MDLKVLTKKKNELLNRTELVLEMHEKTIPAKVQLREKIAALINSSADKIVITKVDTKFGSSKGKVNARAYETVEAMKKTEPKYIVVRNFGEEKKEGAAEANSDAPASFKK